MEVIKCEKGSGYLRKFTSVLGYHAVAAITSATIVIVQSSLVCWSVTPYISLTPCVRLDASVAL